MSRIFLSRSLAYHRCSVQRIGCRALEFTEWFGLSHKVLWLSIVDLRPWDRMAWLCLRCRNFCCPPSCIVNENQWKQGKQGKPGKEMQLPWCLSCLYHWKDTTDIALEVLQVGIPRPNFATLNVAPDCQARRVPWPEIPRSARLFVGCLMLFDVLWCRRCSILFDFVSCCCLVL